MSTWPKDKLLKHGADLPIGERIRRYKHNILAIRDSGCAVPTSALIDTLDPAKIELWFADGTYRIHRLNFSRGSMPARAAMGCAICLATAVMPTFNTIGGTLDEFLISAAEAR